LSYLFVNPSQSVRGFLFFKKKMNYTTKDFEKAKDWALHQSLNGQISLWEHVNQSYLSSEEKLDLINKFKNRQ